MKKIVCFCVLLTLAAPSVFGLEKPELDLRIRKITSKFEEMQLKPEKRIPADALRKAHGIIMLDRTKAGFIFAFQGGTGVGLARNPKTQAWSPVAFYKANEASLGFQIGGQQSFMVILMMTSNATQLLTGSKVDFGGEASGTAGDQSGKAEGTVAPQASVLVYDDRKGLYGGAAVKGGAIEPDEQANVIYYGQALLPKDILFENKAKSSEAATELAKKIAEHSKPAK